MHVDAANAESRHLRHLFINGSDAIQRDAKFTLALAGGDVSMRMRLDVGIHPQSNRRDDASCRSDTADRFEFLFAFDVETENVLFERVFDFLLRFPDAGECATLRVAAGLEHAEQFAP